uniref:Calpain catalytic domain-containing protein n=1 Tax=Lepeophtheirus salmonis TaxID=72036 RepID=A0A0K2V2R8_LEPSM
MEIYKGQAYAKLKKHHLDLGFPWTDPTFPASDTSIGDKIKREFPREIKWLRPKDIVDRPKFVVNDHTAKDVNQGKLGNCWFVAAAGTLAGSKPLWDKVVPDAEEQEFDIKGNHPGVFRFRFYRFGSWTEVLVDDLLPTYNGSLIFSNSQDNTEFWGALLEKAYAKLHGNYAVLQGGNLSDALVDFTSGVSEVIGMEGDSKIHNNEDMKNELFKTMIHEVEEHSLMCCAIHPTNPEDLEKRTSMGLIIGHAYGITAVRKITIRGTGFMDLFKEKEKLFLVRLQNPWGEKEWNGAFSDKSSEWANISNKEREKMGLTVGDDGEFWMPFEDFLIHFSEMSICRVINTSVFSFSKTWNEAQFKGQWISPNLAGGCLNNRASFLKNPQYKFDVFKDEEEVMVQLSQIDQRSEGNGATITNRSKIGR